MQAPHGPQSCAGWIWLSWLLTDIAADVNDIRVVCFRAVPPHRDGVEAEARYRRCSRRHWRRRQHWGLLAVLPRHLLSLPLPWIML